MKTKKEETIIKTLEWVRDHPEFLEKNGNKKCFIRSDNGMWGPNKCGYTDLFINAGVYTLTEAYNATSHCGREKYVRYILPTSETIKELLKEVITKLNEIQKLL